MPLLYESAMKYSENNTNCIILCNEAAVLKYKTFKEVLSLSYTISDQLSKYFLKTPERVGILMKHNIFLPSIIMR